MPAQSIQQVEPSGNICGGTSSYVPAGGCGCGGSCGSCGTGPSGNICGGPSSFVPGSCGCGSTQAATVPSGNICGGTSMFTPAGDSCRCSSCISKRMHRGAAKSFPGVHRVGTDLEDPRGRMFVPTPPAVDKRRGMLPNGGGVAQRVPTRTAEPLKAPSTATPAMIPAIKTKPTDLGSSPAPRSTAVMVEGKKEDLGGGVALPAITAAAAETPMTLSMDMVKASAGLWPVYGASGAPMAIIQPMRFANPSKPSFVPGMAMARASGEMYRPSGDEYDDAFASSTSDLDWNQQLLRDTADSPTTRTATASDWTIDGRSASEFNTKTGRFHDEQGKGSNTPARREPSTTDYIRSIGGVATAALDGINRTIGQQADIRLRELMAANANAANVRAEANHQLQIELDAGIRQAQIRAQSAGSAQQLAQLQAEIAAMRDASARSANLALRNEPPSTPLVPPSDRTDEGLSTSAKVGIGVGVVAVLGLGGYLVMRRRR